MEIIWDQEKNEWLKTNRFVSFEQISGLILEGQYLDIVENPQYQDQQYFVMSIQEYTWLVPFLIDDEERIILKTAFPSRKFHKEYGGKQ